MYGILTGDADLAREGLGDVTYYLVDGTDGSRREPIPGTVATVACWGDTPTVEAEPGRAAVAADGTRAAPDAEGHHWGTVCPTDRAYREALLDRLAAVGDDGVRLTTLGFPGESFCHCERCEERFAASAFDDRDDWRADVVTDVVAAAADRVAGELTATLYPDPSPEILRERAGLDPAALSTHVDDVLVPLCGDYGTPYWVESLARGVGRALGDLDASVTIQLSADGTDADRLTDVTRMVEPHCDAVVYGTFPEDAPTVREVVRRRTGADDERVIPA